MTMDKQQERLGSGKRTPPRDNLDLDVMDALAMGYGCQYGRFKADHPLTKDANEERLAAMQKKRKQPAETKPPRKRREYFKKFTKVCKCCGNKFVATNSGRRYCSDLCKGRANAQNRKSTKEVKV